MGARFILHGEPLRGPSVLASFVSVGRIEGDGECG